MDEKEIKFIQDQIGYTFKTRSCLFKHLLVAPIQWKMEDRIMRSLNLSETRHWILLS